MARRFPLTLVTLLALDVALAAGVRAQEPPAPEPAPAPEARPEKAAPRERRPSPTLRVQVVLTRFQDEKKVASLPYTFVVNADGNRAFMRMGIDTPIPTTSNPPSPQGESRPSTSFQYKTVGTNIDCSARDLGEGRYQLTLAVENSSALAGPGSRVEGAPLFRRFETKLNPVLRDGQSLQTIASTDPVTGEVVKIDVTMTVVR